MFGNAGDLDGDGTDELHRSEFSIIAPSSGQLNTVYVNKYSSYSSIDYDVEVDVYAIQEGVDGNYGEGTKIKDNWRPESNGYTLNPDTLFEITEGKEYTIEFVTQNSGTGDVMVKSDRSSVSTVKFSNNGATKEKAPDVDVSIKQQPDVSVTDTDSGTTQTIGPLSEGQTETVSMDLSRSSTVDFTNSGSGGTIDYTLAAKEGTETVDPTVCVNENSGGGCDSYTGTLPDGSTKSLTADTAWLQSGTNTVTVSVGDGTLSSDAPTPQVGLSYSHDAADRITTNYTAEQWSERYNVSHQYSSDRTDARLRIPFAKEVYDVTNVEMRVNGGTWTAVSSSDYTLEPRNLTVQIGSVSAGDTIEVRTTARKVKVANGDITVSEPSEPGQTLDSQIQINSWSDSAYIEVPEHKNWQQVHYTYNESWNAESSAIVDDTGYQRVHMPNAVGGDQARVSTIPLEVMPSNGDVEIEVADASTTEPQVRVSAGEKIDDPVDYTLIDAKDDTDYILWSVTHETVKDSGTASSPLTLSDDDSDEVLEFRIDDSGGDGGGGGGGGFWGESQQTVQQVQPALSPMAISGIFIGLLILSVGYTEYRKRRSSKPVYRRPLVWLAIGVGAFLSILLLNPMAITEPIQTALSATLPLAGVLGVIGVAAWLYMRQQQKNEEASTPDTVVEIAGQVSSNDSQDSSDDGGGGWL